MTKQAKHVHFIGIAGTLIAPLAVAMKKQGWQVSGSDQAFYPPMSTYLAANKIKIIPGFNPEKFDKIGLPDLAVMMSFLTPQNPEVKYLTSKKVLIISLGQLLEKYFIKKKSIVVAGNFGKTTITSLLAWILEVAGMDPTVLGGGYMNNFQAGVKIGFSDWSVSEGDEFKNWHITANYKYSRRPRLLYQKPTHVVFTDATWDHYDQYPTKEEYLKTFIKFIKLVPKSGIVVGNANGKNVSQVLAMSKSPIKLVRLKSHQIKYYKSGSKFFIGKERYSIPMLGYMGAQNAALAITLAQHIGINTNIINKALRTFKGIKRRQEIIFKNKQVMIIDDFAHSPVKLCGVTKALRLHFPTDKIILVYQPGSKDKKALSQYPPAIFNGIDYIILPRISSLEKEARHFNFLLAARLKNTELHDKVKYLENDEELIKFIHKKIIHYNKTKKHVIVLFAAQKGWRGITEDLAKMFKN